VEEVIQVGTAPDFASVSEALDMVQAALSYLAAADAAQLPAATQAECLRRLERSDAIATAARAFILAGFTAGQGYADDADYSAVAWLIHQTRSPAAPPSGTPPGPAASPPIRGCSPRWPPGRSPSRLGG
jgi:hypothetical protein